MHLQEGSKKELMHIAAGTALCTAVMWVIFAALHLVHWAPFDYTVILSGVLGAAIAVANFWGLCVSVERALDEPDEKRRKARLQLSYNGRMLGQGVWIVVSLLASFLQPVAAIAPLTFPRVTIYYLQITGYYKPKKSTPDPAPEEAETAEEPADAPAGEAAAPGTGKGGET